MILKSTPQKGKYELHLTFLEPELLSGWHPSRIEGDPLLGSGPKYYLTSYADSKDEAESKLALAMQARPTFIRAKIEHIIYDVRVMYDARPL
jgi:hypothetical protein